VGTPKTGRRQGAALVGSLAEWVELTKRPTVLLGDIARHVFQEAKNQKRRRDVIHPSELARDDWCPRREYYQISDVRAGKPVPQRSFSFQQHTIFAEGHEVHSKWQGWLADMGILAGCWRCLSCELKTSEVTVGPPKMCPRCGQSVWDYAEVPLSDAEHLISGHADGYIADIETLIEIKTIGLGTLRMDVPDLLAQYTIAGPDGREVPDLYAIWKELNTPLLPHVRQANIYMWLARRNNLPVRQMVFLYEFKATQAAKEFVITPDESVLTPLLEKAKAVVDALDGRAPIPQRAHEPTSNVCEECPYFSACYGVDRQRIGQSSSGRGAETGSARATATGETAGRDTGPSSAHIGAVRRSPDGSVPGNTRLVRVRRRPSSNSRDSGPGSRDSR